MFVAPTEPDVLKTIADAVNMTPERHGVDYLWPAQGSWAGVQRKEVGDLRNSVEDGRLTRELAQMDALAFKWVLVEGAVKFTADGTMIMSSPRQQPWTRHRWEGTIARIQQLGAWIAYSADVRDSVRVIEILREWSKKPRHGTLTTRPGPVSLWGKPGHREFQIHILQGFDGIGPELAGKIVDKFGGVPLAWTVSAAQLQTVDGMGKVKARKLLDALADAQEGTT